MGWGIPIFIFIYSRLMNMNEFSRFSCEIHARVYINQCQHAMGGIQFGMKKKWWFEWWEWWFKTKRLI
jgi:hypothetical protein